jgi:hypothetical protein
MSAAQAASGGSPPPLAVYRTRWQESVDGTWQPGLDFALGFTWDAGHEIPQPVVHLMGQDVSQYAAIGVNEDRCLVIALDLSDVDSIVCDSTPELYLACTANLSADGESFSGLIERLCSGPVKYNWKGECQSPVATWLPAMHRLVEALTASGPSARSTSAISRARPVRASDPATRPPPAGEPTK